MLHIVWHHWFQNDIFESEFLGLSRLQISQIHCYVNSFWRFEQKEKYLLAGVDVKLKFFQTNQFEIFISCFNSHFRTTHNIWDIFGMGSVQRSCSTASTYERSNLNTLVHTLKSEQLILSTISKFTFKVVHQLHNIYNLFTIKIKIFLPIPM
jgi:hypothetical protein